MNVSVIILNFNRPNYIRKNILPVLVENKNINEIIISHGKKETYFNDSRVKSLDHSGSVNEEYGLSRRFLSGLEAKNKYVIIMDDDITPTHETINFLYEKIKSEDNIIHGLYGRNINPEYSIENVFGDVGIILTRCLITTRDMCEYYVKNFRTFEDKNIKESKPYWNGEDILFSLLSIKRSKKLNRSYDLAHYNRIWNYINLKDSISLNNSHINYRKKITKKFLEKIDIKKSIEKTNIKSRKSQFWYFFKNSTLLYVPFLLIIVLLLILVNKYF